MTPTMTTTDRRAGLAIETDVVVAGGRDFSLRIHHNNFIRR